MEESHRYPDAVKPASFPFPGLVDYQLLDSGGGEKLERFGEVVLRRPDPQAIWHRGLAEDAWAEADGAFERESDRGGAWVSRDPWSGLPDDWTISLDVPGAPQGAKAVIRPTPFKHVGVFPEQAANWVWLESLRLNLLSAGVEQPKLLNLFAYTGAASVLASLGGWQVTHVDSSKASLDWAAENARVSGLDSQAIRWMHEDALKFAAREVRRGNHYHAVLMDPPAYGRGPKGEKWLFAEAIAGHLADASNLLEPEGPAGMNLSAYAIEFGPLALENLLRDTLAKQGMEGGQFEIGELSLPENSGRCSLPCGFGARWTR